MGAYFEILVQVSDKQSQGRRFAILVVWFSMRCGFAQICIARRRHIRKLWTPERFPKPVEELNLSSQLLRVGVNIWNRSVLMQLRTFFARLGDLPPSPTTSLARISGQSRSKPTMQGQAKVFRLELSDKEKMMSNKTSGPPSILRPDRARVENSEPDSIQHQIPRRRMTAANEWSGVSEAPMKERARVLAK